MNSSEPTNPAERFALNYDAASEPPINSAPVASPRLRPDDQARMAARSEGNQLGNVETYARDYTRKEQAGARNALRSTLNAIAAETKMHKQKLKEAKRRLGRTEEMIPDPEHHGKMSWVAKVMLGFMLLGFLAEIIGEQYGASLALLLTGAFAVDTIVKGVMLTMTALTVGFAVKLAYNAMRPALRRLTFAFACVALVLLFATWALSFASGAGTARDESARAEQLSAWDGVAEKSGAAMTDGAATQEHDAAWRMFLALVLMMPLTAFVANVGVEHYLDRFEVWIPNPEHQAAADDVRFHEGEIGRLARSVTDFHRQMGMLTEDENHAVSHSRTLYLAERARLNGGDAAAGVAALVPKPPQPPEPAKADPNSDGNTLKNAAFRAVALALIALVGAACDRSQAAKSESSALSAGAPPASARLAMMKVIAISDVLPGEAKKAVIEVIDAEVMRLKKQALEGATVLIVDAGACRPVATLRACKGVARMRERTLAPELAKVRKFLQQPRPRAELDGRMRFTALCQVLGQLRLPAGTPIVVLGNPLEIREGRDAYFSMKDGAVPSHGLLFEDPKLSLYSVVGRERALEGLLFHWGYPTDQVFADDSHMQAVKKFQHAYLKSQGAVLVTFQPSIAAAGEASRQRLREPMLADEVDLKAKPEMIRIVKVIRHERESANMEDSRLQTAAIPANPVGKDAPPAMADGRLPNGAMPVGEPVVFDSNSAKLTKSAREAIGKIAAELERMGRKRVILVASADPVGAEKTNADLAERRGRTVEAVLVAKGIAVQVLSVGESLAPDDTPSGVRPQFRTVRAYTAEGATAAVR